MSVSPQVCEHAGLVATGASACARCATSAKRCAEMRPQRKTPLHAFVNDFHGDGDEATRVCYFCQREWGNFWRILRPDVLLFFAAPAFRPVANPRGQPTL